MNKVWGILVLPAILAGCASQPAPAPVVAAPIGQAVPDGLLTCAPEPPGIAVRTDRDAARYVTDLAGAGRDCRRRLAAARAIIRGEK